MRFCCKTCSTPRKTYGKTDHQKNKIPAVTHTALPDAPTVLIVLHQAHSTPGRVGRLLVERGIRLDIRRPPLGDPLPSDLRPYAGVVIFGGPMSANDDLDWLKAETDWIGRVLKAETPFLGLCLGAQMLAKYAGARVYTHEKGMAEIGYYPLHPTTDGLAFSKDTGLDWPCHVYQWHRDGFDVPAGATVLAQGEMFPEQAFVMGRKAYALQFHPEVTYAMMCRWTTRAHERMAMPGARTRTEHLAGWYRYDRAVHHWIDGFLDHWLAQEPRV
jgi:GMP synthase (glutamine-hydrolysing)